MSIQTRKKVTQEFFDFCDLNSFDCSQEGFIQDSLICYPAVHLHEPPTPNKTAAARLLLILNLNPDEDPPYFYRLEFENFRQDGPDIPTTEGVQPQWQVHRQSIRIPQAAAEKKSLSEIFSNWNHQLEL